MKKSRPRNKREPEDAWPPPTLKNFRKDNPEPYRMPDGTEVILGRRTPPKPEPVRLVVRKPPRSLEEYLERLKE